MSFANRSTFPGSTNTAFRGSPNTARGSGFKPYNGGVFVSSPAVANPAQSGAWNWNLPASTIGTGTGVYNKVQAFDPLPSSNTNYGNNSVLISTGGYSVLTDPTYGDYYSFVGTWVEPTVSGYVYTNVSPYMLLRIPGGKTIPVSLPAGNYQFSLNQNSGAPNIFPAGKETITAYISAKSDGTGLISLGTFTWTPNSFYHSATGDTGSLNPSLQTLTFNSNTVFTGASAPSPAASYLYLEFQAAPTGADLVSVGADYEWQTLLSWIITAQN